MMRLRGTTRPRRRSTAGIGRAFDVLERRELLAADVSVVGEGLGAPQFNRNGVLSFESIEYTMTITNHGDAEPVVLTMAVDPRIENPHVWSITPFSITHSESYEAATGVLTVEFTAPAGTAVATIEGFASPSPTGVPGPPLTTDFSITTADANSNPQTSGAILLDALSPIADVSLTHQGDATPIQPGADVIYTLTATNHSTTTTAPNAKIAAVGGFEIPVDRNPGWTNSGYAIGDLAPGESKTVSLVIEPKIPWGPNPTMRFSATLTADAYDFAPPNNVVSVSRPFASVAQITVDPPAPTPSATPIGEYLTFTFQVRNSGPNLATGLVFHQSLPAGASFVSATYDGVQVGGSVADGVLAIALPDFPAYSVSRWGYAPGNQKPIPLVVTLNTDEIAATEPAALSAPFDLTWNEHPGDIHGVTEMGTVTPRGTLLIKMSTDALNELQWEHTSSGGLTPIIDLKGWTNIYRYYAYTVTNPRATDAHDLVVTMTLPPESQMGVIPRDYTVESTATAQIVTFHLGVLPAGASRLFRITAVPLVPGEGLARVTGTLVEAGRPASDYPPLTIDPPTREWSDIDVQRLDAPEGTLKFAVTNFGPSMANVLVSANYLADPNAVTRDGVPLDVVPFPIGPGTNDNGYELWRGDLAAGESTIFELRVTTPIASGQAQKLTSELTPWFLINERLATGKTAPDPTRRPQIYLFVGLKTDVTTVETGGLATFTALATNAGPFAGENLTFTATIPAHSRLVSASSGVVVTGNVLTFTVASLPVGATASLQYVVSPTWDALGSAVLNSRLDIEAAQPSYGVDYRYATASIGVIAGSSGTAALGAPSYAVDNRDGALAITVNRVGGASGPLTVDYAVEGIDAVPGVDFTPVSGTLNFADGETSRTIVVPILYNPNISGDRDARVTLSNGGSALITIHDSIAPTVNSVTWSGPRRAITEIAMTFARPLAATTVLQASNFVLATPGRDLRFGTRDDRRVAIVAASYNPETSTLTLRPARPLIQNTFHRLTVSGLIGAHGLPMTPYTATLARGTSLRYVTAAGSRVVLRLRGGGYLDDLLDGSNSGRRLMVVNPTPRLAVLSGRVFRGGATPPRAYLGPMIFGSERARVRLPSPPFVIGAPPADSTPTRRPRPSWAAWLR